MYDELKNKYSFLMSRSIDGKIGFIVKRTYRLIHGETCRLHEKQEPLVFFPVIDDRDMLVHDWDVVVSKERSDVILKAVVHAPNGEAVSSLNVGIEVDGQLKKARVFGDRKCRWEKGRVLFTPPQPFTSMPLDYTRAYGGSDEKERASLDYLGAADLQQYVQFDLNKTNLCMYPRNTVGKGYVMKMDDRLDGLELPNIEDPDDLLTPERLIVQDPKKWYKQPLPAGFDYYNYGWFPRSAHNGAGLGGYYEKAPDDVDQIRELKLGYLSKRELFPEKGFAFGMTERILNAASPGLSFPYLNGDEKIKLFNMDSSVPKFVFRLPDDKPRMMIRPLDEKKVEVDPHLYTVLIEKEENRVSLVWGGVVKPKLPHGPEQIAKVEHEVIWPR